MKRLIFLLAFAFLFISLASARQPFPINLNLSQSDFALLSANNITDINISIVSCDNVTIFGNCSFTINGEKQVIPNFKIVGSTSLQYNKTLNRSVMTYSTTKVPMNKDEIDGRSIIATRDWTNAKLVELKRIPIIQARQIQIKKQGSIWSAITKFIGAVI